MSRDNANALVVCLALFGSPAFADVFVMQAPDGSVHLTDRPHTEGYRRLYIPAVQVEDGNYVSIVRQTAKKHGIDPLLVHAIVLAESNYDTRAVSKKGACGLMQLMPETARRYGVVDRFDAVQNVEGGVRYLRDLIGIFKGDLALVLAAYNAGEGAVLRFGRVPAFPETQRYVKRVTAAYNRLQRRSGHFGSE